MNDGLMDDEDFDRMVNAERADLQPISDPFSFEGFIHQQPWEYGGPPGWRQLAVPQNYLSFRLPRPTSSGWITMTMSHDRVHLNLDGRPQASMAHVFEVGDLMAMSSYPVLNGVHYEVTVQKPDSDERRILLTWTKYDDPEPEVAVRRPWWRRWLDRAWPARALR